METIQDVLAQVVSQYRETVRSALGEREAERFDKHPLINKAMAYVTKGITVVDPKDGPLNYAPGRATRGSVPLVEPEDG